MSNGNNALDDYLVLLDKKKEASQKKKKYESAHNMFFTNTALVSYRL